METPETPPFGPWNPGIESQVPERLLHLCTLFRPEHAFTDAAKARELKDLTGLDYCDLAALRPERLALHEVLIRVTADLAVPDGEKVEDLGVNFRAMVRTLLAGHVEPEHDAVRAAYDNLRREVAGVIGQALSELFGPAGGTPAANAKPSGWFRKSRQRPVPEVAAGADHEQELAARWDRQAHAGGSVAERAAYRALARVASALLVRHERIWGGRELIADLATDLACNDLGSDVIGALVDPLVARGAELEGYARLPRQREPVVFNTKGASASGKSTLRPRQRALAQQIGVQWTDFALISPDIWRKQLLDYASLGDDYKYGGAFTGDELSIVDQKLDRYMARKAERGEMTHLLIDRFRFDSFAPDSDEAGSNLLTRFGHTVYLFFMLTPPASLVERAWNRGLEVGRYKAVDDTLAHGVQAYSGMPELFFTWIERRDKRVHFEFLDNSVALGERPRTVAFGWNDSLHVLDVKALLDVERFRRVDVDALSPAALYRDPAALAPERNAAFLRQCVLRFRNVDFADQASGRVYLRVAAGTPVWTDAGALAGAAADPDTRAGLQVAAPRAFDPALGGTDVPVPLTSIIAAEPDHTLGRWGSAG